MCINCACVVLDRMVEVGLGLVEFLGLIIGFWIRIVEVYLGFDFWWLSLIWEVDA